MRLPGRTETEPGAGALGFDEALRLTPSGDTALARDAAFVESARRFPGFRANLKRLAVFNAPCPECREGGGTLAGTSECPVTPMDVDPVRSRLEGRLVLVERPCPLYTEWSRRRGGDEVSVYTGEGLCFDDVEAYAFESLDARTAANASGEAFRRAVRLCQQYAKASEGWVYLHSRGNGTGKTRLLFATLIAAQRRGVPVRYTLGAKFFSDYKGALGLTEEEGVRGDEHYSAFRMIPEIEQFEGYLAIDDLGKEVTTPRFLEFLYLILDYRYLHNLPTLFASNYSQDELMRHYSGINRATASAIASRMAERTKKRTFDLSGLGDYRELKSE